MSDRSLDSYRMIASGLAQLAAFAAIMLVLAAVAQPIFSDDLWWHLALGRAYLDEGPWLAQDPLLFTSEAAPPPASWLADTGLALVWQAFGFSGLRLFHLVNVLLILGLAWSIFKRHAKNPAIASVLTALVGVVSAYRFVQLRPHLGTMLAALLLYVILIERRPLPSWSRVAAGVALIVVWAQIHAAYGLGPILLGTAAAGVGAVSFLRASPVVGKLERRRAGRLIAAMLLGLLASGLHPMGYAGLVKAMSVAGGGESLAVVVDEWGRFRPFVWPSRHLPPTPLVWFGMWALLLATPLAAIKTVREWLSFGSKGIEAAARDDRGVDPALVALALAGGVAMAMASRFVWLCVFPLAFLVHVLRSGKSVKALSPGWVLAGLLIAPAFWAFGDWPPISRGIPTTFEGYRQPYAERKYHAPAVWFLSDAGLRGNLFGRYEESGFLSFWLGPSIRMAMNGTLNMSRESFDASLAIRERLGTPDHPRFEDALDALGVDLFLGTGLPTAVFAGRPPRYSTAHLEVSPEWILVFRNLDSAIYLRRNARNAENLDRVVGYYLGAGVPFDRGAGFEVRRVLDEAPDWARENGVWTAALRATSGASGDIDSLRRREAGLLALGLYEEAIEVNAVLLSLRPGDPVALGRRAWLLMRPSRPFYPDRLARVARQLATRNPRGPVLNGILRLSQEVLGGEGIREDHILMTPVLTMQEGRQLQRGVFPPALRWE